MPPVKMLLLHYLDEMKKAAIASLSESLASLHFFARKFSPFAACPRKELFSLESDLRLRFRSDFYDAFREGSQQRRVITRFRDEDASNEPFGVNFNAYRIRPTDP